MTECTGISANWCQICGDCCCLEDENGCLDLTSDDCPLHSRGSKHGEIEIVETAWGPVELPNNS